PFEIVRGKRESLPDVPQQRRRSRIASVVRGGVEAVYDRRIYCCSSSASSRRDTIKPAVIDRRYSNEGPLSKLTPHGRDNEDQQKDADADYNQLIALRILIFFQGFEKCSGAVFRGGPGTNERLQWIDDFLLCDAFLASIDLPHDFGDRLWG